MKPNRSNDKIKISLYPKDLFEKLEFNKIIELLRQKCSSPLGLQLVDKLKIEADPDIISQKLQLTHEFKQLLLFEPTPIPADNYLDLQEELRLLAIQAGVLTEQQMFRLYTVLQTVGAIVRYFGGSTNSRRETYPNIFALCAPINVSKTLLNHIKNVMNEDGKVRSDATPELARIRKTINSLYRELSQKFNAEVNEARKLGYLADSAESIRNGRHVLAVLAEHKRKIKGIVHDISATGNTLFIEPEATLHISNEIVAYQQAEKQEIYKIMQALCELVRPFLPDLSTYQKLLAIIDFLRAKALLAIDLNATMPRLSKDKTIELFSARHPLLLLRNQAQQRTTVPLNLQLNLAERILLVSGPNAGGKSVMLKTVGLLQIMLQAGLLVPLADHSSMSIFRQIFVDIGDEQSIENDLSTYSSKLKNMCHITENANAKSLILIDEFGAGTDPAMGGAIAEAILEYLNQKFSFGVITTHYSNLKVFASQTKGIINGSMLFDYKNLSPLYQLSIGKPGSSFAFELATKSGLNQHIIQRAKNKMDKQYKRFDELLSTLQTEKQAAQETVREAEKKLAEANSLISTYTNKNEMFEKTRKQIMLEAREKAAEEVFNVKQKFEKLLKELRENKKDDQKVIQQIKNEIIQEQRQIHHAIETLQDQIHFRDAQKPPTQGAYVRLRTGKEIGKVEELRKDTAIVTFGDLRTNIKLKELVVVEEIKNTPPIRRQDNSNNNLTAKSEFDPTIDIRGMRRDEALQAVENHVDKALMLNIDNLKIIHGIGDGILRRSVRSLLQQYKDIKSITDEEPQYGGAGVTLIELG